MKSYQTLLKFDKDEQIIQKSRFIGYASPVETEQEALDFINKIRKENKEATHNCYAYIIGENAGIMRYSDDGEPSGTAGLPIIEVLKVNKIVNVAVVVTRYFGGVLLGAGGLVRAYNSTCARAINKAQIATMYPSETYICEVAYPLWDRVEYSLKSLPIMRSNTSFMATVVFEICMKTTDTEMVFKTLTQVTEGKIEYMLEDTAYYPWLNT